MDGEVGKKQNKNNKETKPAEYIRAVKAQLRSGKQNEAFRLLQQAVIYYPEDPYIVSYYGLLQAIVEKKYRTGVETCKRALGLLRMSSPADEDLLYPVLYLNLGRAYVAAGKKKDALDTFEKGLKYDVGYTDLRKDLRALGTRKQPPLSFLDRSNPINKYVGKILHALTKEQQRKK